MRLDVGCQPCDRRGRARKMALRKFLRLPGKRIKIQCGNRLQRYNDVKGHIPRSHSSSATMSAEETTTNGTTPGGRTAIGISFGNSNSSIAYTTFEDKAEVIANEDGGM
jgi:hypothetical protein